MRGGAQLHCVVNGAAGRERAFESARPPANERIAVIGAGPAGLTYASLVAANNAVTVFERAERSGGAFRYAGKAPLFQDVVADQNSFDLYIEALTLACAAKGVTIRYHVDVTRRPELLRAVRPHRDRDRSRLPLRPWPGRHCHARLGRRPLAAHPSSPVHAVAPRLVLPPARGRPTGADFQGLARPGQQVVVIGDALAAGKSRPAISSAFEAALRA